MLKNDKANAGIVLELCNGLVETNDLFSAMELMLNDEQKYLEFKRGTTELFSQFDIRNFAENYYKLYVK